jgi:hypothetical protein
MARRVYFSFHYDRDIIRVSQIRNSGTFSEGDSQPFLDKAEWEKIKKKGDNEIIKWINEQMDGTSVLILCIGSETNDRKWVRHEIKKAFQENRGIVGIYIHKQKNFNHKTDTKGINPLDTIYYIENKKEIYLSSIYSTYDWVDDKGHQNIQKWIEEAANKVGR